MDQLAGLLRPRKAKPSPLFTFYNTVTLVQDAQAVMDLEEGIGQFTTEAPASEYQRFLPFRNMSVLNNSVASSIRCDPNCREEHGFEVLNRGAQDLSDVEIRRWRVTNKGSTDITPRQIVITVWSD